MRHHDGKLGETILFASDFNRYEVVASSSDNYATIDEAAPGDNDQGTFALTYERGNPSGNEKRVLVAADHVGGKRRPIARLVFDIVHDASSWQFSDAVSSTGGQQSGPVDTGVSIRVRPVTSSFSSDAVTWTAAAGLSYGDLATAEFIKPTPGTGIVLTADQTAPGGYAAYASIDADVSLPGLFAFKAGDIDAAGWNALDAIHGWELSIRVNGNDDDSISWTGDVSDPDSVTFAILA